MCDRNPRAGRPSPRGWPHFRITEERERSRREEGNLFPPPVGRSRGLGFPRSGCPHCGSSPDFQVPIRNSPTDKLSSHKYRNVSWHFGNRSQQGSRAHSQLENRSRNRRRSANLSRDSRFRENRRLRDIRSRMLPSVRPRANVLPPTRSTHMMNKSQQSPLPRTQPPQLLKSLPPLQPSQEQSQPVSKFGLEALPPDHKGVGAKDRNVRTYAQVVQQRPARHRSQLYSTGQLSTQRQVGPIKPVDPKVERRCLRCLGRGHNIRECRDPVTCRLCLQPGHRQASCPSRKMQSFNLARFGLADCLVGEVQGGEPSLEYILEGLQTNTIERPSLDVHNLASGDILIRKLPKEVWKRLLDTTQQTPGGGTVKWRKPQPSDGEITMLRVSKRLEIRGVPFGLRTWSHLELISRPIGTLQKIVCNGLQTGDPNCLCLDVEVNGEDEIPRTISVAIGGGRKTRATIVELPPPPPRPVLPLSSRTPGETTLSAEGQQAEHSHPTDTEQLERPGMECSARSPAMSPAEPLPPEEIPAARTDGSGDYLLLRQFSRRSQNTSGSSRADSWFSQQAAKQWVTLRPRDSTAIPPLDALGASGPRDETAQRLTPPREVQQPAPFIPDTIVLSTAVVIGEDMGANCGDSPCAQ